MYYHISCTIILDHYHVLSCAIYPEINFVLPYIIYHIQLFLDHYHVISCAIMCYLSRNQFCITIYHISYTIIFGPLSCDIMCYHVLSIQKSFFGRYLYGKRWGSFELLVLSMCSAADHDSHGTTGHDFEMLVSLNTICSSTVNHMIFGLAFACDLLSCWKGSIQVLWAKNVTIISANRRKLSTEILPLRKLTTGRQAGGFKHFWSKHRLSGHTLMAFGGPVCNARRSAEVPTVPGRFSAGVLFFSEPLARGLAVGGTQGNYSILMYIIVI